MKGTKISVEDVFSNFLGKEGISPEQITKLNIDEPKLCKH